MLDFGEETKIYISMSVIAQHWYGTGIWNPSLCKIRICWSYLVNTIVADDLVKKGAQVLSFLSQNILLSALEGFIFALIG